MDFARKISQMFHDEHLVTVATLERFEALLHRHRKQPRADPAEDAEFDRTLRDVEALIASDVNAHFKFEEENLFPLLADAGDGEMSVLLAEEHKTILDLAASLTTLSARARAGDMQGEDWDDMRRRGMAFVELMVGHIQKEEMGLLLTLDDVLDEKHDAQLVMDYSAAR